MKIAKTGQAKKKDSAKVPNQGISRFGTTANKTATMENSGRSGKSPAHRERAGCLNTKDKNSCMRARLGPPGNQMLCNMKLPAYIHSDSQSEEFCKYYPDDPLSWTYIRSEPQADERFAFNCLGFTLGRWYRILPTLLYIKGANY